MVQTVTNASFAGKPYLMFFGFTHCPDICPTKLAEISIILDELGDKADDLNVLFVSVDPERDTPEVLKEYISSFHPQISGLSGSVEAVAATAKSHRAYYRKVPLDDATTRSIIQRWFICLMMRARLSRPSMWKPMPARRQRVFARSFDFQIL
jgi:cytochrome oxidase Cu insertion factor (SCO1/SenC/PrrC family)